MPTLEANSETLGEREVTIRRTFDAPAILLFEAYSKAEHVSKWFGPRGWPITLCEIDFRVGGRFRFAMTGPSGVQQTPFGGTYHVIEPNSKIVYDNGFESESAERMIVTITFDERDGKTMLTIHTLFASVAMRDDHVGRGYEAGVGSGLDQLADVVARVGVVGRR